MNPTPEAVDCHAHVFSADAPAVPGSRYRPAYEATLGAWRLRWREAGITRGVLVQPSFFGTDNGEMMGALASAPRALRGVAVVSPVVHDDDVDRLHAVGVRAVRLNLKGRPHDAKSLATWLPLLDRLHARGWHLELHGDAGTAPLLADALGTAPIAMVFDHFAFPGEGEVAATVEALARLARTREVGVKLSAPYRLAGGDAASLARTWLEALGARSLLWGSDWPWTQHEPGRDYRALRDTLDEWLGPEVARVALWDNAARFYGFE